MANPKPQDVPYGFAGASMRVPRARAVSWRRAAAQTAAAPTATTKFDYRPSPFRKGDVNSASLLLTPRLSRAATLPRRQYTGNVREVPRGGRNNPNDK